MKNRILIVDDEYGLADIVAEILTEHGYETSLAINGKQALERMESTVPDLVLLDVMMPVLDGRTMLNRMRSNPLQRDIPVIMMTALPEALPEDASSFQGSLKKPFSQEALLVIVRQLLGP